MCVAYVATWALQVGDGLDGAWICGCCALQGHACGVRRHWALRLGHRCRGFERLKLSQRLSWLPDVKPGDHFPAPLQSRRWVLAVVLYSLAVSVKMNVLLMAPGVLAVLLKARTALSAALLCCCVLCCCAAGPGVARWRGFRGARYLQGDAACSLAHFSWVLLLPTHTQCSMPAQATWQPAQRWAWACRRQWGRPSCVPTPAPTSPARSSSPGCGGKPAPSLHVCTRLLQLLPWCMLLGRRAFSHLALAKLQTAAQRTLCSRTAGVYFQVERQLGLLATAALCVTPARRRPHVPAPPPAVGAGTEALVGLLRRVVLRRAVMLRALPSKLCSGAEIRHTLASPFQLSALSSCLQFHSCPAGCGPRAACCPPCAASSQVAPRRLLAVQGAAAAALLRPARAAAPLLRTRCCLPSFPQTWWASCAPAPSTTSSTPGGSRAPWVWGRLARGGLCCTWHVACGMWLGMPCTLRLTAGAPGCTRRRPCRYWHTLPFLLLRSRLPLVLSLASLAGIEVRLVCSF